MKRVSGRVGKDRERKDGPAKPPVSIYRGSTKHKNRPADGSKGTLCPEWTHQAGSTGLAADMLAHPWPATRAAELFEMAVIDPESGRRYATERGIAFEAKPTNDESWHGYPIPWEAVPTDIKDRWLDEGVVKRRQTRAFFRFGRTDIHWALQTDE